MRPSVDHGVLSPSGHVSARAREATLRRETVRLFPEGFWTPETPSADLKRAEQIATLRRQAQTLMDLAARGMKPRAHRTEAARLLAAADALTAL